MSYIILLLATSRLFLIILKNVSDKSHPMPSLEIIQFLSEKFFNISKKKRDFLGDKVKTPDME